MNPANKALKAFIDFLVISIVAIAGAAVVHYFMLPFNLTIGSIPGLAMVVSRIIPLSVSTITMICNGCLLLAGILLVGKEFGLKTIYSVILFTGSLAVLEGFSPAPASIMEDPFLDMLCYIFLMSACQAILFDRGASLGGLDIVAKILNKLMHMDVGKAVSNAGLCVAVSSVLVFDLKIAILSVLGTYLNGIVVDHFIFGINPKKNVSASFPRKSPKFWTISSILCKAGLLWWRPSAHIPAIPSVRSSPLWISRNFAL